MSCIIGFCLKRASLNAIHSIGPSHVVIMFHRRFHPIGLNGGHLSLVSSNFQLLDFLKFYIYIYIYIVIYFHCSMMARLETKQLERRRNWLTKCWTWFTVSVCVDRELKFKQFTVGMANGIQFESEQPPSKEEDKYSGGICFFFFFF